MSKVTAALAVVFSLALAAEAMAQRGGGGGGRGGGGFGPGGGFGENPMIDWYPSIESAMGRGAERAAENPGGPGAMDPDRAERWARRFGIEPVPKKYIFVFVRLVTDDKDPTVFNNNEFVMASRREWAFVKMDFDREHPYQKAWGLRAPPACVTLDMHGNEILKASAVTIEAIRGLIRNTPDEIVRFETKLKVDFQRAIEALKVDESRGVKALIEIALLNRVGYKEIADAQAAIVDAAEAAFKNCELLESATAEQAIAYLEELVRLYRFTSPGVRAEIRIARLEYRRENIATGIQRLTKVLKYDPRVLRKEIDEANSLMGEFYRDGDGKVTAALAGNKSEARDTLRKIAKDYAGTEVSKRASEEMRKLD